MTITSDEYLPVSTGVGYMLKILKSGMDINYHKDKFNAIKHGDYDNFFILIQEPQPFLLQWKAGEIKTSGFSQKSGDCDVTMLLAIEPSLQKFIRDCYKSYGDVFDSEISDLTFQKCAAFEIALRVQLNKERQNRGIPNCKLTLEKVIEELCVDNNISDDEKEILQNGRKFVNMVKGHKPHFPSWESGIIDFESAWSICNKYHLKVCW